MVGGYLKHPTGRLLIPTVVFMDVNYTKKSVQLYGSLGTADGVENTNGELALLADGDHSGISGGPVPVMLVSLALRFL